MTASEQRSSTSPSTAPWLLYGATGFTGELLAEEAVRRGHRPVLCGRTESKLAPLAARLGLEYRVARLDDAAGLRKALEGKAVVLHAAGPFTETAEPMLQACLDTGASYLDITGERTVFERAFELDERAHERKVALMCGLGFDVVPTDCLALHVASKLPGARRLELAIASLGGVSGGTAKTSLDVATSGRFLVRRNGELVPRMPGRGVKRIRFSQREHWAVVAPLADVESAWHTTRIPDITTYLAISTRQAKALRFGWPALALGLTAARAALDMPGVHAAAMQLIEKLKKNPDDEARQHGQAFVWARVTSYSGDEAQAWLETIEPYEYTRRVGILAVEKLLEKRPFGALTPGLAFGADFALEVPGTRRLDALPEPLVDEEHQRKQGSMAHG